jgi:hypothetical protein
LIADAIRVAKKISRIDDDSKLVTYRRQAYPNDNTYNILNQNNINSKQPVIDLGIPTSMLKYKTGLYYLWTPDYLSK